MSSRRMSLNFLFACTIFRASICLARCSTERVRALNLASVSVACGGECLKPAGEPAVFSILYSGFKLSKYFCSELRYKNS